MHHSPPKALAGLHRCIGRTTITWRLAGRLDKPLVAGAGRQRATVAADMSGPDAQRRSWCRWWMWQTDGDGDRRCPEICRRGVAHDELDCSQAAILYNTAQKTIQLANSDVEHSSARPLLAPATYSRLHVHFDAP